MPDDPAPRACPSCGADNRGDRELCAACGADLDSGQIPPRANATRTAGTVPSSDDRPRGRVGVLWVLLAIVLGVVLVLVGLGLAGVGPFARGGPELPEVSFAPDAYPGEKGPLTLTEVATRTTLEEFEGEPAGAAAMADDDPTTAWRSDGDATPDEDGEGGEDIDLLLEEPAWVSRVVLRNGSHADPETYVDASRLREARLIFDGGVSVVVDLQDAGLTEQEIELPEPQLTTVVRIEVREVFPGSEHDDLALSDVRLEGWAATGDDVELAARRAELRPADGPPATVTGAWRASSPELRRTVQSS